MKKITLVITICLLLSLICAASPSNQKNDEKKNIEAIIPIIPIIAEYEYTPVYLSQDIKGHPKYWRINAVFDPAEASSVEIVLIEKGTNKRVYYCNSPINVEKRKAFGDEAILTRIDFKPSESDKQLPIYGFGFLDKNKQPVLWRVIPTGTPSIRGAGLNNVTGKKALRIEYRDIGTTVGEGTAVKIGDKVFEAEPWTAISSPPFFYAFHGSFTLGRHMGALRFGSEKWQVTSRPATLKKGEQWVLKNDRGYERTLKIVSNNKKELVIDEKNSLNPNAALLKIVLHITPDGYSLHSVKTRSRKQEMRINFEPELPLLTTNSAIFEGKFTINQGEHKSVVAGKITRKHNGNKAFSLKWEPMSPSWAKSKSFETKLSLEPQGYSILATNSSTKQ